MVNHTPHSLKEMREGADAPNLQVVVDELALKLATTQSILEALMNDREPEKQEVVAFTGQLVESKQILARNAPMAKK